MRKNGLHLDPRPRGCLGVCETEPESREINMGRLQTTKYYVPGLMMRTCRDYECNPWWR